MSLEPSLEAERRSSLVVERLGEFDIAVGIGDALGSLQVLVLDNRGLDDVHTIQ